MSGKARAEKRIQVVNRRQVRRHHRVAGAAKAVRKREFRPRLMHLVHGVRFEVVQGNDSGYHGRERRGNLRIAHVGNVLLAFHLQVMDLRLKRFAHLPCCSGKINHHPAGVDHIHPKSVRLQPARNCVQVLLRHSKSLSEFLRGNPAVEIRRSFRLQLIEERLKSLLLLGSALQLKQHVLHGQALASGTPIVLDSGFGMRIAPQRDPLSFINILCNARTHTLPEFGLRARNSNREENCQQNNGEGGESHFA